MYCMRPDTATVTEIPCETPGALVVMTPVELQQHSPFYLDPESAGAIGGALLLVMATAWCMRAMRKTLEVRNESE